MVCNEDHMQRKPYIVDLKDIEGQVKEVQFRRYLYFEDVIFKKKAHNARTKYTS